MLLSSGALALMPNYELTKRFDAYAGPMYSGVQNGLANSYLFHTTNINPIIGVRFKFL
jgi:hypothetical protein